MQLGCVFPEFLTLKLLRCTTNLLRIVKILLLVIKFFSFAKFVPTRFGLRKSILKHCLHKMNFTLPIPRDCDYHGSL